MIAKKIKLLFILTYSISASANLCKTMSEGEFDCINSDGEKWVVTISSSLNAEGAKVISISPKGNGESFYDRLTVYWPNIVVPKSFGSYDFRKQGHGIVDSSGSAQGYSGGFVEHKKVTCSEGKIVINAKKEFQTGKVSRSKTVYKLKDGVLSSKRRYGLFSSFGFSCDLK